MKDLSVIIVAGGSGHRMGSQTPKQFLVCRQKPILMHSIAAFAEAAQVIVVLPEEHIELWRSLCVEYSFDQPHQVVCGGRERFFSVRNGLAVVDPSLDYVAVHDGVRPWVSGCVISRTLRVAREYGVGVPAVGVVDSIRLVEGRSSRALERGLLRAVQTPQIFQRSIIQGAYDQPFDPFFTDDASVVESFGVRIFLSEGDVSNIKITTPRDLLNV